MNKEIICLIVFAVSLIIAGITVFSDINNIIKNAESKTNWDE